VRVSSLREPAPATVKLTLRNSSDVSVGEDAEGTQFVVDIRDG